MISLETGANYVSNVADTFKRRDWFTLDGPDGSQEFGVEELLATEIDGPAAKALQAMQGGDLSDTTRWDAARFMAAQMSRGVPMREMLNRAMSEVGEQLVQLAAHHYTEAQWIDSIGEVPSPGAIEAMKNPKGKLEIKPSKGQLITTALSGIEELAHTLMQRTWHLVAFDHPVLFTSDAPVALVNSSQESLGFGLATADQVYLPVTPTIALVLEHPWSRTVPTFSGASAERARLLNWSMFISPHVRQLLCHPDVKQHPMPSLAQLTVKFPWPWPAERTGGVVMPEWWQRAVRRPKD